METCITRLLNIRYPIVQGGMQNVGYAELASAVSNGGGLGIITGLTQPTPEDLAAEISRCRNMTDEPFGVNLTLLPTIKPVPYDEYVQAVVESGVKIVETTGRNPEPFMPVFNAHGIKVIHKCTSVRHALKAEKLGCAAVSVDGFECAGHPGEDDIPNLVLLPAVAAAIGIPILASGGIGTGSQMAACLALGADGVNMGTRFMATQEAPIHDNIKQALVDATELDTTLVYRSLRNTARVHNNTVAKQVNEIEQAAGNNMTFELIRDMVAGSRGKVALTEGDIDYGIWTSGIVQGLIDDIPTCEELIQKLVIQCQETIDGRLNAVFREPPIGYL